MERVIWALVQGLKQKWQQQLDGCAGIFQTHHVARVWDYLNGCMAGQ